MRFRLSSGLALGYATRGSGRIIALLHPVGMRAAFWLPVAERLARRYRVIAVDTRGHGDSDVPSRPFTLDELADDVAELLRALAPEPSIVVGCSMGGMIAQGLALRAPELVSKLVLSNTAHTLPAGAREVMEQRAVEATKGMPAVLETTIARWFSESFRKASPDVVTHISEWLLESDPIVHATSWRAIRDLDYAPRLNRIRVPVLVLAGSADVSTPPALAKALHASLPKASYREFAEAGHMSPLEQPALFAAWTEKFIETAEE